LRRYLSALQTAEFKSTSSALKHFEFVQLSILELVFSGRVVESPKAILLLLNRSPFPSRVVGKKRLILDLRYVNKHIFKHRVKFEDWRVGLDYFEKGSYFTKLDYKSGYHHLGIFPDRKRFLGFSCVMSDGTLTTLVTKVGKNHSIHNLPHPHPCAMLTKHFYLTQVCILPFSNIERGNGGVDTNSVGITIIISCFRYFPTQFVQGCSFVMFFTGDLRVFTLLFTLMTVSMSSLPSCLMKFTLASLDQTWLWRVS